jgi:hypothetical protein
MYISVTNFNYTTNTTLGLKLLIKNPDILGVALKIGLRAFGETPST